MAQDPIYVDFSLPLTDLLRKGIAVAHEEVERSQGASWLLRGELDRAEYVRFLMMLWNVYDTLERGLEQHASHPVLSFTYNPVVLSRAPALSTDIAYFLQMSETHWQSHPSYLSLIRNPPASLTRYLDRIQGIIGSDDPSALLSHAYVRYLGDLSGGQVIRNKIVKAYDLSDRSGTSFFDFKPLGGTGIATTGDMKKIKVWYRDNMNVAVGDNKELKADIVEEAIVALELNGGLFSSLNAPSSVPKDANTPALPPLGDPVTPVDGSFEKSGGSESTVLFEETKPAERVYQLTSVIAVVAAMSLAHFVLVVGGFTGDRGSAKLEALRNWLFSH